MRKEGKTFRDIGLIKEKLNIKALFLGIISALIWVLFMQFIYIPSIKYLFEVPDYIEYNFIRNSMTRLLMTIAAAWIISGFYEEIVFRGYIWHMFEKKIFRGQNPVLSIFTTSFLFGAYHLQQDIYAVIAAVLGGLYWTILYRKFDNLWISMYSHALFDTVTLILIYTGKFGNFSL